MKSNLTSELAEFMGIISGDGYTNHYLNFYKLNKLGKMIKNGTDGI